MKVALVAIALAALVAPLSAGVAYTSHVEAGDAGGTNQVLMPFSGLPIGFDTRAGRLSYEPRAGVVTPVTGIASGLLCNQTESSVVFGCEEWQRRESGGYGWELDVETSHDGNRVFVSGWREASNTSWDYAVLAIDAVSGVTLWRTDLDGGAEGNDYAHRVAVSRDDSRVFVTGQSEGAETGFDFLTVAYDASTGTPLWTARFDMGGGYEQPYDMVISPDGSRVYVTGYTSSESFQRRFATVAYDAESGLFLWSSSTDGAGVAYSVDVTPDGTLVIVNGVGAYFWGGYVTVAYDAATGREVWVARDHHSSAVGSFGTFARFSFVRVSPDGDRLFMTGVIRPENSLSLLLPQFSAYLTVAYDVETGAEVWNATYDGAYLFTQWPAGLVVSPDGSRVFVTGTSLGTGVHAAGFGSIGLQYDYATLAYDSATGVRLWESRYASPMVGPNGLSVGGSSIASGVAVSADGSRVYVTGTDFFDFRPCPPFTCPYDWDSVTVAHEAATGIQLWSGRFAGDQKIDYGFDVAVSPTSGSVYVSVNSRLFQDSVIVAYRP